MKKIITITILLISSLFIANEVSAVIAYPRIYGDKWDTGIDWYDNGVEPYVGADGVPHGGKGNYMDRQKLMEYNGNYYPTYCVDPGLQFKSGVAYECETTTDPGLVYLMSKHGTVDYSTLQMAMRFYASSHGYHNTNLVMMKAALIRYKQARESSEAAAQIKSDCASQGYQCSDQYTDYLRGNESLIDAAWVLYQNAETARAGGAVDGEIEEAITLFFHQESVTESGYITYRVTSSAWVNPVTFTCEGCNIINQEWNNIIGEVEIYVPNADTCPTFQINAFYPSSSVQICHKNDVNDEFQWLITDFGISVEGGDGSVVPSFSYSGDPFNCSGCCEGPDITIRGTVNNCCYDSTHTAVEENALDELFCEDSELNLALYKDKCNNAYYIDSDIQNMYLNDYCTIYCTERATVDTPGAKKAVAGKYFSLNYNEAGPIIGDKNFNTTSPYLTGVKRCRIKVFYDKWEEKYYEVVNKQIAEYNAFQKEAAYEKMYNNAINGGTSATETISVTCTVIQRSDYCTIPNCTVIEGVEDCKEEATSDSGDSISKSVTLSYTKYSFSSVSWYEVKVDETPASKHKYLNIIKAGTTNSTSHDPSWVGYSYPNEETGTKTIADQIAELTTWISSKHNQDIANSNNEGGSASTCEVDSGKSYYSCGDRGVADVEDQIEDVVSTRNGYSSAAASRNSLFNGYADQAKVLEQQLDKCTNFFTNYEGKNASDMYEYNPELTFSYNQEYLDDFGMLTEDRIEVEFEEIPGCVVSGPSTGADEDISGPQYSSVYNVDGDSINNVKDFKNSTLAWQSTDTGFSTYLDDVYNAEKKFTHDGKYTVNCAWSNKSKNLYTLVPSGKVSETTYYNFTSHNYEYHVYITVATGTYQTNWGLTKIGENGKFDDYIKEHGTTCEAEQPDDSTTFTCGLEVWNRIMIREGCDTPPCDSKITLNFKVIDPKNFFPSGTTTEDGKEYAYNWVKTSEGEKVMKEIVTTAQKGETYAPSHISYSFELSPTAMRHIKNYNVEKNETGGYNDFNLTCECPAEVQTGTENGTGKGCIKCKSIFIENLEDGFVRYDGHNHVVNVWSGTKTLNNIRTTNNWAGV